MKSSSPFPEKDVMCHRASFEKSCFKMVTECNCRLWVEVRGVNPQTGEEIPSSWNCVDMMVPMLQIETSQQMRQAGAATESLRNELVALATTGRPTATMSALAPVPVAKLIGNG